MAKGLAAVLVLAVAAAWAVPAMSNEQASTSATTKQLTKRVKKLERRVRALAILNLRQDVAVDVRSATMRHVGGGQWNADPSCGRGEAVSGGVQFPTIGSASDHPISSYPTARGWYSYAVSSSGVAPVAYVVCARIP